MEDILTRFWENLLARSNGPMNFRLLIQPIVAGSLAIRAGLRDAREGRPAFLWAVMTNPEQRRALLQYGARDVGRVFGLAVVLDALYQLLVQRGVYLLEMLVVATVLAIIPYILIRGPVGRLASALHQHADRGVRNGNHHGKTR